jgi:hypothetical protein
MVDQSTISADDYTVICYTLPKYDKNSEKIKEVDAIGCCAENGSCNPHR